MAVLSLLKHYFTRPSGAVPTILQQEAVECGAACLGMILAYYGRWVALERLREQCGVSRDGTAALNILKAARDHGLVAVGVKSAVPDLAQLDMPVIVFWNFNHFVVVESVGGSDGVRLNDPATGPRTVSHDEFDAGFTGVVLAFEPGPGFERNGGREGLSSLIRRGFGDQWRGIAMSFVAGILLIIPALVTAGFAKVFIDDILLQDRRDWLKPLLLGMVATALFKGGLNYLQQMTLARTQIALSIQMTARQMWTILDLPMAFFSQRFPGDIANRFAMVDRFTGMAAGGLVPAAIGLMQLLCFGAVLFALDLVLGLVTALAGILACAVLALSARKLENSNRQLVSDESRLQAATIQGIAMSEELRMAGREASFVARWAGFHARLVDAEQRAHFGAYLLTEISACIFAVAHIVILIVGGLRVIDGTVSIGTLVAFQTMTGSFFAPLAGLINFGGQAQQLRGLAERLDDISRYHGAMPLEPPPDAALRPSGALETQALDLVYAYGPLEPPVLHGVSLTIPAGARIALVGDTGSGKSTLGRLLVGLVRPVSGAVTLGGVDIARWTDAEFRQTVAYVDQVSSFFQDSVSHNLSLWDGSIGEDRIVAAARDAEAHGFITARSGGYDTLVSEGGGNFSGGERQRLAIARALLVDPTLLILDEATSSLDPPTEQRIMDAIRRRGCSCVIIAHRLSTIRDCDQIYVIRDGRIIEAGTHAALMARQGEYRRLVEH